MAAEPLLSPSSLPQPGATRSATQRRPVLTQVLSGIIGTASAPPPCLLATRVPGHCVPGTGQDAVGRGLCTLRGPRGCCAGGAGAARTPSSCPREEGQAEPKPTLAEPGPGGSVRRGGDQEARWLAAGQAGGGSSVLVALVMTLERCGRPAASGQAGWGGAWPGAPGLLPAACAQGSGGHALRLVTPLPQGTRGLLSWGGDLGSEPLSLTIPPPCLHT